MALVLKVLSKLRLSSSDLRIQVTSTSCYPSRMCIKINGRSIERSFTHWPAGYNQVYSPFIPSTTYMNTFTFVNHHNRLLKYEEERNNA